MHKKSDPITKDFPQSTSNNKQTFISVQDQDQFENPEKNQIKSNIVIIFVIFTLEMKDHHQG
ncbi:hypothetical protein DERP_006337 [Dermatophagoides pteronyssinus]|uniref:Uncharacterized protein n=1 Tax=Dermatophagoides pteronyssinus TaxID=6956 RepID=A0ABQ8IY60_DERPT|nr:hypothetical protein DERP_006337 [Dermatophagoides pteronyssinus]